jgi:hypothetical protein
MRLSCAGRSLVARRANAQPEAAMIGQMIGSALLLHGIIQKSGSLVQDQGLMLAGAVTIILGMKINRQRLLRRRDEAQRSADGSIAATQVRVDEGGALDSPGV